MTSKTLKSIFVGTALSLSAGTALADQVILDDLIVDGSLCVGFDCVNGESFGFDTIRLKENNLRIHFEDTSTSASFPSNDWRIVINDTSNGGGNYFAVGDTTGGRLPFRIEAGAPFHSLYVDDGGRIGFGTATPVVELHIVNGDTPTMRLEQDGSSGFTPQTWDVAGNETNFFIRDASNGSTLPLRIRPGAPSSAVDVEGDGDVRIGKSSATDFQVDILQSTGTTVLKLATDGAMDGAVIQLDPGDNGNFWNITAATGDAGINFNRNDGASDVEMSLDIDGNLVIAGNITAGTAGSTIPDYVFADDYELMPLHEVEAFIVENRHLPKIPSAADVEANGLNMTEMQIALLEKVEELTLYTLEQQRTIDALQERLDTLAD